MVSTGAPGPAGAQAERAASRGKSVDLFFFFCLEMGPHMFFARDETLRKLVLTLLRFLSFALLTLQPPLERVHNVELKNFQKFVLGV